MGSHFEKVAEKKAEEEQDPVMKVINTDPEVKEILQDPEVQKVLHILQTQGGLDLFEVMRKDPRLGQKFQKLIEKGVLNVNSSLPA